VESYSRKLQRYAHLERANSFHSGGASPSDRLDVGACALPALDENVAAGVINSGKKTELERSVLSIGFVWLGGSSN